MTPPEKESLCQVFASLFSPPDREMERWVQGGALYSFLKKYTDDWGEGEPFLNGFLAAGGEVGFGKELEEAYEHLFSDLREDHICLVESFYKPWTQDIHCSLLFASNKGLLMGDSALHLSAVYEQCGMEISEEFKWKPDHLVLELEFLSLLYRFKTDMEIKAFINHHLDWVPSLKKEFERFHPHRFYVSALDILDLFLRRERERLEVEEHG